jgi:hypothetical protein
LQGVESEKPRWSGRESEVANAAIVAFSAVQICASGAKKLLLFLRQEQDFDLREGRADSQDLMLSWATTKKLDRVWSNGNGD